MKNVKNRSGNLHLWQSRNFSKDSECLSNQAATHLNNIAQISAEVADHGISANFASYILEKEKNDYARIIDDKALSLPSGFQNKSILWKSSLSIETIKDLKCIQDLLQENANLYGPVQQEIEAKSDGKLLHSSFHRIGQPNPDTKHFPLKSSYTSNTQNVYNQTSKSSGAHINGNFSNLKVKNDVADQRKRKKYDSDDEQNDKEGMLHLGSCFKSAKEQLALNQKKKIQVSSPQGPSSKKSLGSRPRNPCFSKFVPPSTKDNDLPSSSMATKRTASNENRTNDNEVDPKLKGIEPQLIELVLSEIMDHGPPIGWEDIAGLEFAKATIKEIVIWPMLRPDIFTGLRGPPKGILLFGPPGTGKTLIGKCIANQSGATFFSISASSLTSKWIGQAEKMVRALFAVASLHQPAVIFIDEIDSLLCQRSDSEHESSRRIKTEFFVQLDGATTSAEDRILVVGATNRPHEIDEAARRRLVKRLYIPLPDDGAREQIITKLMEQQPCQMLKSDILSVVKRTDGYSGADVANLCKDAALGPIRSLQSVDISRISKDDVRAINVQDFEKSLQRVKASVSAKDLALYEEWNKIFGCGTL
ncbi:unnamed protein product [Clavelina lepadiformis]|uniref:Fidgetin-like protein 1 n=1 Tax=Clavelina lepadiformis TaxID=159417 RepID=A0ABP0G0A4_CLALP